MTVEVLDRNDERPFFNPTSYNYEILEGVGSKGITIANVLATDADIGINAVLVYNITSGNLRNRFGIHPQTVSEKYK